MEAWKGRSRERRLSEVRRRRRRYLLRRGSLHPSFPRRKRHDRPNAGEEADPGGRPGRQRGRHRSLEVRLRRAGSARAPARGFVSRAPSCVSSTTGSRAAQGRSRSSTSTTTGPTASRPGTWVLACYNMMIPYIVPGLPPEQHDALKALTKVPLQYSTVGLRNWRALKEPRRRHCDVPGQHASGRQHGLSGQHGRLRVHANARRSVRPPHAVRALAAIPWGRRSVSSSPRPVTACSA